MTPAPSTEEFVERVLAFSNPMQPFQPVADYDADGDCIEFIFKPDPFYAERVDDLLTIYRSQLSHELIGSLIKGVKRLRADLDKVPAFFLFVEDGKVQLQYVFLASMVARVTDVKEPKALVYKKLVEAAEETDLSVELCGAGT